MATVEDVPGAPGRERRSGGGEPAGGRGRPDLLALRRRLRRWRLPDALPALGPRAMRVYVAIWSVFLVGALFSAGLEAHTGMESHRNPSWPALGLEVYNDPTGAYIDAVPGAEARAAGVRRGDLVLAVDGRTLPSATGAARKGAKLVLGPDGASKRLTIRTRTETPRVVVLVRDHEALERRFRDAGMSSLGYHALETGVNVGVSLLLIGGACLLFRQRRSPVAALLSLAFLGISDSGALLYWLDQAALGTAVAAFGWMALLLGVMTMPDGLFAQRWTRWLAAALLVSGVVPAEWMSAGLSNALSLFFTAGAVAAMGLRYRRLPSGSERQQLRWAFFGFAAGAILLVIAVVLVNVVPLLGYDDPRWGYWRRIAINLTFSLAASAFALGLIVSLMRYRLYDADAVIGRSAGYALLTVVLAAAFGVSAKLIETFFETSFSQDAGVLPGAVGAGLVLTLIAPAHRRLQGWAERRFQRDVVRLRRELPPAVDDLRETAGLGELLDETLGRVMRGTRATRAAVVVDGAVVARRGDGGETWPTEAPLRIAHQELEVGLLLVGPRPDGTAIGKDEREALAEVADPVARAVRIVRAREAEAARQDARMAAIEARLPPALQISEPTSHTG